MKTVSLRFHKGGKTKVPITNVPITNTMYWKSYSDLSTASWCLNSLTLFETGNSMQKKAVANKHNSRGFN